MLLTVEVDFDGGRKGRFSVIVEYPGGELLRVEGFPSGGTHQFDDGVSVAHVFIREGGYWPLKFDTPGGVVRGRLHLLPPGPGAWWHDLHGAHPDVQAGKGVRIGVIDEALPHQAPGSILAHVRNLGGEGWNPQSQRAFEPLDPTGHGTAVCALITSRPQRDVDVMGLAPGAELVFAAAGSDVDPRLDTLRVAESLSLLVDEQDCDIISCSAGDHPEELPAIRKELEAARERGVLCFFAAGNQGALPGYPARYESCLAVGALGHRGAAPPDSAEGQAAAVAAAVDGLFYWPDSARGPGVDFAAAGVSVYAPDASGIRWYSRSGTSFATPIMAGLAARLLSKDDKYQDLKGSPQRVTHALALLRQLSFNPFADLCGAGVCRLP